MTAVLEKTSDADDIRRLLAAHIVALHDKDVDAATVPVADDVLCFDLAPPLASRGREAYRQGLEGWFPTWDGPIDYEQAGLEIAVGGDVAFATGYNRLGGAKRGQGTVHLWVRVTIGLKRTDGRWTIVHEHLSVPFAMDGSFKACIDLTPSL